MDKFELEIVVMYAGMIVGCVHDNDIVTIKWIGPCGTLCERAVKLLMKGTSAALPFVRNGELCVLMIGGDTRAGGEVVKVSNSLECYRIGSSASAKMPDANTYIYMPTRLVHKCVRVEFVGDAYSIESTPHAGYLCHDGERFWKCRQNTPPGSMQYISSDPAYNFEMPDRFGDAQDARNGLILNLNVAGRGKGMYYTLYILCSKVREMIWTYTYYVGERIDFMHVGFFSDNVVVARITDIARITTCVFINTADNTAYEIIYCL